LMILFKKNLKRKWPFSRNYPSLNWICLA